MATDDVEKLKGTWDYVDGEHFDDYMKEIGVSFVTRQSAKLLKPRLVISENNGTWTLRSESNIKTVSYDFVPGVAFDETTPDGREVKSTIDFTSGRWVHKTHDAKNNKDSTVERYIDEQGQQQVVMTCGGVKARRWYKRAS